MGWLWTSGESGHRVLACRTRELSLSRHVGTCMEPRLWVRILHYSPAVRVTLGASLSACAAQFPEPWKVDKDSLQLGGQ